MSKTKILELKKVTRSFIQGGSRVQVLKETNFNVYAGELVAIIGPSGSGKSTLLTIAGGLQKPTKGRVLIDGKDISKFSNKKLSAVRLRDVGFILQASNLVPFLTIEKQLELIDRVNNRKADKEAIEGLFKGLGIHKLRNKYPGDLSGGERQRVAIAKALYGESKLILADEPTASLDTQKAYEVVELLAKETRELNKATIMVTHDKRLIGYCDKVYTMQDGKLTRLKGHEPTNR